ncbi:MAG: hypothetical protein IPH06_04970 [Alphaproteobacteria bacterium]|nr:hypothetical protein [Alphaproteobacteria bacterium]QQS57375.1 MAG: hypothetical protein IPN28_00730 [Alphaproteobacteria bacterium]
MGNSPTGLTTEQQIFANYEAHGGAFAGIRRLLGLPEISEYTPQIGAETKRAHEALLKSVPLILQPEYRTAELYRRISPRIPAELKSQLDSNPQAKSAFMATFLQLDAHVDYLDRFYQASQGAAPAPAAVSTAASGVPNYTPAQRQAIRSAMDIVSKDSVPAELNNSTAHANLGNLTNTARAIGTALRMNVNQIGNAQLGQALETKLKELTTAFVGSQRDPSAVTQAQINAHFKNTYGFELSNASKVIQGMKTVAVSGAFSAAPAPAAPAAPAPAPQEVTPDARTMQAMDAIRTQVFPALDIRPRGTDVAAFGRDFGQASQMLANLFQIQGDPNSPQVRTQITQKLNELATHPKIGALRDAASLPMGASSAFRVLVQAENREMYDRLPQAVKDNPSILFALLDNRNQIFADMNQVYASNILNPQVVPAQVQPAPAGSGQPAAPAPAAPATGGGADSGAAAGGADALQKAAQIQQEIMGLASVLGVPVTAEALPQLAQNLQTALTNHRTNFFTQNGTATQEQYIQNLRNITGVQNLTIDRLNKIVAAAGRLGQAGVITAMQSPNPPTFTAEQVAAVNEVHQGLFGASGSGAAPRPSGPPTDAEIRHASTVVESALIKLGGAVSQIGGGFGGSIAGLAGFSPPTQADGVFDEQSQNALHMVLMGLKKLGGDKNADGTYTAAIGQKLMHDILVKENYEVVRQQLGLETMSTEDAQKFVRNPEAYIQEKLAGEENKDKREKLEAFNELIRSLNTLERANKLNNEKAKGVTFMGTVMDKIGQFLPESMKGWLKNFFENDKIGQMLAGFLNMFGFPVQRLWGGQAPGGQQVRQTVRDGYYNELQAVNFDHAKLKERILTKMDESVAFKAVERLLFHGAERGHVRAAVTRALDAARDGSQGDPNRAAEIFADEMVKEGERYKALSPAERANYLQQVRDAYQQEVSSMPGVPAAGAAPAPQPGAAAPAPQPGATPAPQPGVTPAPQPQPGTPQINPAQAAAATAAPASNGVPNYTDAQLRTVSQAMTLAGMTVPAIGLTREGAKTAIEQIHAQTSSVLTKLGINAASNRYAGSYDDIGAKVTQRLAEERRAFFTSDTATEAGFRDHLKTKFGIENAAQASNLAKAFVDIQKSGAMNLGAPQVTPAQAVSASAAPSADGSVVQTGDKRFEIILTPDTAQYTPGPTRYSYGRVVELQNILSQNSRALELSTKPEAYMRAAGGRGTDTMTRSTCMALEELAVRAQLAKGVELSALSHRYNESTISAVTDYMRGKGMNQQDIEKFVRTVRDLEADMKSTNPRDRSAGPVQQHSVWDQSYIRNQVSVRALAPAPAVAPTAAPSAPVDRYPGIRMSPENELPPGMTVEQLFERYKQHNSNPDCPNQGPLILQHEGRAYAGVVLKDSNTFKVIELDGYLEPPGEGSRRQTLNDSDFAVLRDNYKWHNPTKAGIVAYIDNQLCLEPKAPAVAPAAAQPQPAPAAAAPAPAPASPVPPVRDQFRSSTAGTTPVPRNYWELPRVRNDVLEGLDKGCLNARELKFLYDRAVATREIREGGPLLTRLNPEDRERLGGDMIISVRNTRTKELEHRLVNFEDHKIKIGGLTENYSRGATIRRLDDFLGTKYDDMAMTVSTSAKGDNISEGYKRDHSHVVDDALRQLFMPGSSGRIDNQRYYYLQREYEGGENGGRGEQGYMTRQMYRGRDDTQERISNSTLYRGGYVSGNVGGEHDHGSCEEFNDRSGRRLRRDYEYEHYRGPGSPLVKLVGRVFTGNIGDGNRQLLDAAMNGDQQILENMRDCRTRSTVDPVHYYERGGYQPGSSMDRTPGVVDLPR